HGHRAGRSQTHGHRAAGPGPGQPTLPGGQGPRLWKEGNARTHAGAGTAIEYQTVSDSETEVIERARNDKRNPVYVSRPENRFIRFRYSTSAASPSGQNFSTLARSIISSRDRNSPRTISSTCN